MVRAILILLPLFLLVGKSANASFVKGSLGSIIKGSVVTSFSEPWAMTFINDNELLVTSKIGKLWVVSTQGKRTEVSGVPKVAFGGQGGLGDIIPVSYTHLTLPTILLV